MPHLMQTIQGLYALFKKQDQKKPVKKKVGVHDNL